ncbi:MAG TPA: hypothetical protein VFQ39_06260, partial [Longimicrobium sp.]|nr:hypothetical protein [Longimicrobium sp.]
APGGLSLAGWWRILVSHPLFLLLLLGWLWRLGVWARFLWGVAGLRLRLVAAHPDQRGGLRFLCGSFSAFSFVGFAAGAVVAGDLAQAMVFQGTPPRASGQLTTVGVTAAVVVALVAAPLLPFAVPMRRARLEGAARYGALALALGRYFEERWVGHPRAVTLKALDANDFSATTDLYSVVANALRMNRLPFGLKDFVPLVIMTILPFAPLGLLVVPPQELVKRIAMFFF